jgi:hypothetical protein
VSRRRRPHPPESLWRLAAPPLVWALHCGASYAAVTVACGRWASASPAGAGPPVAAVTLVALAALAGCLMFGTRGRPVLEPARALDDDTPADRAAFVATTNALLVLASGVAVLFVAAAVRLVPQCR